MNLSFLQSFLWPLMLIGALPIVIHLIARAKPRRYPFSSILFLKKIQKENLRMKRPRDWLLLLLRTLFFLFLGLLFLDPVYTPDHLLSKKDNEQRNVVILIDGSASMSYVDDLQSRFTRACAEATAILSTLKNGDKANVIFMHHSPNTVFPALGVNIAYLKENLQKAHVTYERASVEAALLQAMDMLKNEVSQELWVLSDFQKTNWSNMEIRIPEDIKLRHIRMDGGESNNIAVTRIHTDPKVPLVGEDVSVFVEVSNYSPVPVRPKIYFQSGEMRKSVNANIKPWRKKVLSLKTKFQEEGESIISVKIGEDSFSLDNQRWHKVQVREQVYLGLYSGNQFTARAWKRVFDALPWLNTNIIEFSENSAPDLEDYDLLALSGWPDGHDDVLATFVSSGKSIIAYSENNPLNDFWSNILPDSGIDQGPVVKGRLSNPIGLTITRADDSIFDVFLNGEYGNPASAQFKNRATLKANFKGVDALLSYTDGVPALMRYNGKGKFYWWNMSIEEESTGWISDPVYFILLAEIISDCRYHGLEMREYVPGERMLFELDFDRGVQELRLLSGDKETIALTREYDDQGVHWISEPLVQLGLYFWSYGDRTVDTDLVNISSDESDLRSLLNDAQVLTRSDPIDSGAQWSEENRKVKLWPYVLLLMCFLASMDGGLGFLFSRIKTA